MGLLPSARDIVKHEDDYTKECVIVTLERVFAHFVCGSGRVSLRRTHGVSSSTGPHPHCALVMCAAELCV